MKRYQDVEIKVEGEEKTTNSVVEHETVQEVE